MVVPIEPAQAAATPTTMPSIAPALPATSSTAGLASTAPQTPLSIEPAPSTASNTPARAAPWLGLPQQNQPAVPAPSEPPVTKPQTQTLADGQPTAPPQQQPGSTPAASTQPAPGGAATALADTKPQKPTATSSFLSALQKPFSLFSAKPQASKPAQGSTSTAAKAAAQAAAAPATPTEPDAYGSMPVGLEGYCPVTLAERGVWVEGRAQWGVRHRGRTYLFASAEQQKAFIADPDRYAPALSGDDPVLAFDAGKSTPGQRRYGVTYQSRTYLFSSTETRDAFAANPQRYTSGAMVAENRAPGNGPVVR